MSNHDPAANKEASIPNTSNSGVSANKDGSIIPFLMVDVTSPPAR